MYLSQLVVCAALAQLPPAAHVPRAPADTARRNAAP